MNIMDDFDIIEGPMDDFIIEEPKKVPSEVELVRRRFYCWCWDHGGRFPESSAGEPGSERYIAAKQGWQEALAEIKEVQAENLERWKNQTNG